jgi:hypothetical protein
VSIQNATIDDSAIGESEVFRGQTAYLFLNASDTVDREHELTVSIQYHLIGATGWIDISSSEIYYDDTNGNPNDDIGLWVIEFNPSADTSLGSYEFQIRVKNSANGYSNEGDYTAITGTVKVKNNRPTASELRIEGADTVDRGDEIYIFADAGDYENDPDDLIPFFEWSTDGSNWDEDYLNDAQKPSSGANTWRITFSPPASGTFTLGDYDFKVWFEDEDEDVSNEVVVEDLVKVENVPPSVENLNVLSSTGNREESIILIANAIDDDHGEGGLTAIFQYKGPSDSDWTGHEDSGTYFEDSPVYLSEQWQISFIPAKEAVKGYYSFRVQFTDGTETTSWEEEIDAFELLNEIPEVEITSPSKRDQSSEKVNFEALVTDDKDDTFTWEWDFGDDENSEDESPTHTYEIHETSRTYTVTVTVVDGDDGEAEDTITITIPGSEEPPEEPPGNGNETSGKEESNMMLYLLLIIIVVVVVVLLLVFMLNKKKKKPEAGVPPSAPGIQQAPSEGPEAGVAPTAAAPTAEAAAAAPMAAAPPKAAAKLQQIKCPKCGTGFTVESSERPITIECPNCHAKGTLT